MKSGEYSIIKAATWYTIGNILIKGVNFFVLPIFTRMMNTHEYGVYSVYLSYLTIFETAILLGLSSTVVLARYSSDVDYDSYISTIVAIPLVVSLVCMIIANIAIRFCGTILSMDAGLWNCLFISSGAGAISSILGARLVLDGRYKLFMASSAIKSIGDVAISLLFAYTVYKNHDLHLSRVYGSTAAIVIAAIFILLATRTSFSLKRVNIKHALTWGIPLLLHTVATVVLTQSDRILIRYMDSYSSAGIYTIATTMILIPLMLQTSFGQAYSPWFYGKLETKDYRQISWFNDRYIILYGAIIAGFMLVSPELIHIFTEESYWPSLYSLVPLSLSVFGEMLYSIPTGIEIFYKKTTYLMYATIITVVVNIILDVVFIKVFGYHGAAYATAISKIILFIIHYLLARKLDKNAIFSNKVVVVSLVILIVINLFTILTIDMYIVRYLVVVAITMVLVWYVIKNKELLLNVLRKK